MKARPRPLLRALPAAAAIGLIALLTLEPRPLQAPLSAATPWNCLLCGGLGTVDVLLNIALFLPLGLALGRLGFGPVRSGIAGLALSGAVELLQATVVAGRDSSLSDLITNTLGAVAGAALAKAMPRLLRPSQQAGRHLAFGAASAWLLMLTFSAWAIQPAPPPASAFVRAAPAVPNAGRFAGRVGSVTLNGTRALGPTSIPPLADRLARRDVRLEVEATLESWPEQLAPVADVVDSQWEPVLALGQLGQKIVFSVRSRSEGLRLRAPSVKVYRALPAPRGGRFIAGGALSGPVLAAFAVADGVERRAETRLTPGLGWMLLLPLGFYPFDYRPDITSAVWTALPLLLLGYWGARGARPWIAAAGMAAVLAIGLLAIPPLAGVGREGWMAWTACVAALSAGWIWRRYASTDVADAVPPSARSAASP
jgi:hypothetical protein